MGRTTELRREIKRRFVPFAEAKEFALDLTDAPQFLCFHRVAGDTLQVFDIQWEKHGARRFVVNFVSAPASALTQADGIGKPREVGYRHATSRGRLQPGNGAALRNWFRQDKPLLSRLFSGASLHPPDQVVDQLIGLFSELETYWTHGTAGPHLRLWPEVASRGTRDIPKSRT